MNFKKFIPISLASGCAALAGGRLWSIVFSERQSINWANPNLAELNLWWWHLALWSCVLFFVSVFIFLALFRKYVDLRGTVATVGLLAASWTMFVVSNISSDVVATIHAKNLKLGALSAAAEIIETLLWFATLFVLFRTVDDVRALKR